MRRSHDCGGMWRHRCARTHMSTKTRASTSSRDVHTLAEGDPSQGGSKQGGRQEGQRMRPQPGQAPEPAPPRPAHEVDPNLGTRPATCHAARATGGKPNFGGSDRPGTSKSNLLLGKRVGPRLCVSSLEPQEVSLLDKAAQGQGRPRAKTTRAGWRKAGQIIPSPERNSGARPTKILQNMRRLSCLHQRATVSPDDVVAHW